MNVLTLTSVLMVFVMSRPIALTEKEHIGKGFVFILRPVNGNQAQKLSCQCNAGFLGDGVICEDNDECSKRQHDCHHYGGCTNNMGSFS